MSILTLIEWTNATSNPTRGCKKCSPGCCNCYAERLAERFRRVPGHAYERGFDPRVAPEVLAEPLRWASAKKVFVNLAADCAARAGLGRIESRGGRAYFVLTKEGRKKYPTPPDESIPF
jgi:protein gp37